MGMGFELVGLILGGLYVGSQIDKEMKWPGYAVAGAMGIALIGWFIHLIFMMKKFMAELPDDKETYDKEDIDNK